MAEAVRFSPLELTGRSRAHIADLPDPACGLHHAVVQPFLKLRAAAAAAGIDLQPVSSFRDFNLQLAIWNAKQRGERELRAADGSLLDARTLDDVARVRAILGWSALPGASRHHWGTDLDVIDARAVPAGYRPRLVPEEYAAGGVFSRLDSWLTGHAADHGFFRPYATWRGGVQPEAWHLSHAAVARIALASLSVDILREALEGADLEARATVVPMLPAIFERYVRNIDPPEAGEPTSATRPV
jgi:LAS superfamily LD-carboxypeptidase LdcB